jgi:hypothetical protein
MGICIASLGMLLSCGGGDSSATLQSIEITPSKVSAAAGTTTQLMATGIYSDNSHRNLTYDAAWSSSNSAVANVNAGGVASAASTGNTTISAKVAGISGSGALTVTAATLVSIEVTPSLTRIAKGTTLQFVATGIFSDNSTQNMTSQVTWSTSNDNLASISSDSGSIGLATATGTGTVTISAASGAITGSTTLTVSGAVLTSIEITPTAPSIAKGVSQPFVAMGIFSDNSKQNLTTQVTWSASAASVATVSNSAPTVGTVTATGIGTTTLTASTGSLSASTQVTVTPAVLASIQVTPPTPSIASGLSQQFTATGIYTDNSVQNLTLTATWATTAPTVATVSNATGSQGLASSLSPGAATISASLNGVSGTATLTVTPATLVSIAVTPAQPTIAKGLTVQLRATGTYTDHSALDITTAVTWTPATPAVAMISNAAGSQGLVSSASVGSTVVTASLSGVSGSTTLTVSAATLVSISVTASSYSIAGHGLTQPFVATGTYTDASTLPLTTGVTWSSSQPTVATISNAPGSQGVATSVAVGTTMITAAVQSTSGTANLTVTPAILESIAVTPANTAISASGPPLHMIATGTYNDASTMNLTNNVSWTSSNLNVATISSVAPTQGFATPSGVGMTTITAAHDGVTGTTMLSVSNAMLMSIAVTFDAPVSSSTTHNVTQQAVATGTDNFGNTSNITNDVTWSSSDSTVATIESISDANPGLTTWAGFGNTSITATQSSVSGSATLTVAVPSSLAVSPSNATLTGIGLTQQYVATGTYSSGQFDLTHVAPWSSSDTNIATIDPKMGVATSSGNETGTDPGPPVTVTVKDTAMIRATDDGGSSYVSQTLTVLQSFANGDNSIYYLFGNTAGPAAGTTPAGLNCASCHGRPVSGTGAFAATQFYYGTATATWASLSGSDFLDSTSANYVYKQACVSPTDSDMPNYSGTALCTALYQWLYQGGADN